MFLLDDILLAPMKGLAAVCRKVEEAARQDLENQEKGAMSRPGRTASAAGNGPDRRARIRRGGGPAPGSDRKTRPDTAPPR